MRVIRIGLLLVGLALSSLMAYAQGNGTCTVTGTVYDSSGAVVPGAKVQLVLESTTSIREGTANHSGFFSFIGVVPGTYDVKVEMAGFKPYVQKGLTLHINDQVDLRQIALKVQAAGATVEVTAQGTEVTPVSSGETSYTLSNTQVEALSIEGRNVVELLKVLPGAQNTGGWNGAYDGQVASFSGGAGAFTVNGARFDQMAVVSDGGNVIDHGFNGGAMVTPNVEFIQEVKVETGSYSAENPNGPIVMSTITKSGTNHYHGSGYYTVRDGSMNSRDPYTASQGLPKPASRYQYPGFTIGGPILIPGTDFNKNRNKLFFFGGFEWMRQAVDLGVHRTFVPTADMRKGDFSNPTGPKGGIVQTPVCQDPLPDYCSSVGHILPSMIDPGGQVLMNLYALPNADPSANDKLDGNNYVSDIVNPQNRAQQLGRIDYAISPTTNLFARYNHEAEKTPYPYGLWQTWPQYTYPGNVVGNNSANSIAVNLTHAFSPTMTNELAFTASRLYYNAALTNPGAVSASKLGYPYYGVFNNGLDVIPNVGSDLESNGVADLYNEGGVIPSQTTPKWTYTLSENLSKMVGPHLLKAGVYWSHESWTQRTGDNSYLDQGSITLASWNSYTNNPYSDLLIGHASMFSQGVKSIELSFGSNEFDFYLQDSWKVSKRLTLNYGARFDHIGWWYNTEGDIAIFDPSKYSASAGISAYTGILTHKEDPSVSRSGYKPVGLEFAPALGFAWDVTGSGKTVLRGGGGVNYFRDEGISAGFKLVQNPPLQSFDYFSWDSVANGSGVWLKNLAAQSVSAALPWPNVAMQNESQEPRTYSYNLTVQHQLPYRTLLSAGYVGNTSQHLVGWPDINPVPEGSETKKDWPGSWMDASYRKYANIAGIYPAAHVLRSSYNSLQMTASRDKGMFNYWVTYTFAKALGNNYADSFNESRSHGILPWDRTQSLKVSLFVTLPDFGRKYLGNHRVLNGVTDGWQISNVTQFTSGAPVFSIASSFPGAYNISMIGTGTITGKQDLSARYITGTPDGYSTPVLVCDPTKNLGKNQVFNASCFQSPTPGNNGRYQLPYIHGPMYKNSDLSLFKNFKIDESKKLQIRAEAFNFLNHPTPNFVPNGTSYNDPALSLTYSDFGTTPTNASSAGIMTHKFGQRIVQLAAKFYF